MISESKKLALHKRMQDLGLFEKDLKESFIRSSGAGGQKVNKTATCVQLKHLPTGLEVKCQISRTQADNRFFARRILCEKYEAEVLKQKTQANQAAYKIKKQKRRRSRRAKQKMVEDKRKWSQKKKLRSKINLGGK